MSRKEPPVLTDPYATGSEPPPAPEPRRGSLPSVPNLPPPRLPSAPRLPSSPGLVDPRAASHPSIPEITIGHSPSLTSSPDLRSSASYPGAPPATTVAAPGPDAAAPPKKSRLGLVLGLLAGFVALSAAGAAGVLWYRARSVAVLPFEVGSLPEATVAVGRDAGGVYNFSLTQDDYPPEAQWSRLSEALCGGVDVYRVLMRPTRTYSRRRLVEAFQDRRQLEASLACGRDLAKERSSKITWWVTVKVPEEKKAVPVSPLGPGPNDKDVPRVRTEEVELFEIGLDKLPDSSKRFREHRDRGGLTSTHCLVAEREGKRDDGCTDYARASAHVDGTRLWIGGPLVGLTTFGRDFSPKGTNKLEHAEAWAELVDRARPYAYARVGTHEGFDEAFLIGAGLDWRRLADQQFTVVAERLRAAAAKYEVQWMLGDDVGPKGGELRLELVAGGESEAIDLLLDVKEWHAALKEIIDEPDEAARQIEEDLKRAERDYYGVLNEAAVKAIKGAVIERDGKRVTFVITITFSEEQQAKIAAMQELAKQRGATAGKIVAALTAGDKPDESLLRDLGGSDLVDMVSDPEKARRELLKE